MKTSSAADDSDLLLPPIAAAPAAAAATTEEEEDHDESPMDAFNEEWGERATNASPETVSNAIILNPITVLRHGIREPWRDRLYRISAPARMLQRGEISGCLGDLGTFLPDVVALANAPLGGFPPAPFVFWSGVWSLWTGLLFDLPMPVQPMHAVVAVALTEGLTYPQVVASGVWLGAMFFLLGAAPRLVSWLQTHTPLAVVRGLQLGLGLKVVATGVSFVSEPRGFANLGPGGNGDGWGFALFAAVAAVVLYGDRQRPASLVLFAIGCFGVALAAPTLELGFHLPIPAVPTITRDDWWQGLYRAALPQLPVTLLNAVISTAKLADDLFPNDELGRTPVPVSKISLSIGCMNSASALFGHFPSCHGCGGLAGQHLFGARTGSSMIVIGAVKIALSILLGPNILAGLEAFPRSVLGILLAVSGVELAVSVRDQNDKTDVVVMLIGAGLVLKAGTGVGFVISLLAAAAFDFQRRRREAALTQQAAPSGSGSLL
jgi:hypothetical protein